MVQTRSMTRNENQYSSSWKRMNTCGADLNHDVLYLVMMRLGFVEFLSFSKVCKSWRSLALSNMKMFMASKPPMRMHTSNTSNKMKCYLKDFEGRWFYTIIPQLIGRKCVGLTSGYLILFGQLTSDFCLVNLITRHELHFPAVTFDVRNVRAVLVFSHSINGWVFVMTNRCAHQIWFSIAGKGAWNHVSFTDLILGLHAFKGKIYTLHICTSSQGRYRVCEIRFDPVPNLSVVINVHFQDSSCISFDFISSDENLYLMRPFPREKNNIYKVGFDPMNCVPCEKTRKEYALFTSISNYKAVVKPESWAAPSSQYVRLFYHQKYGRKGKYYWAKMCYYAQQWYFPHDCLNVNLID